MMPYLLRGLELSDEDMRANVINTLISVAEEESAGEADIMAEHSTTIIASLLKNSDSSVTMSPVSSFYDLQHPTGRMLMDYRILCSVYERQRFAALASFLILSSIASCTLKKARSSSN